MVCTITHLGVGRSGFLAMSHAYIAQHAARFETAIAQAIQTMISEQPADPVMRVGQLLLGASATSEVEALKYFKSQGVSQSGAEAGHEAVCALLKVHRT